MRRLGPGFSLGVSSHLSFAYVQARHINDRTDRMPFTSRTNP